MCQIWNAYVKEQRLYYPDTNLWWKYSFDIEARDPNWMYETHSLMVMQSQLLSKLKENEH